MGDDAADMPEPYRGAIGATMTSEVMASIHAVLDDRDMTSIVHPRPNPTSASPRAQLCVARLRMILLVNATSSFLSGVVMAAIPDRIDELLDTGRPGWVRLVGIGLMLFAADVAVVSRLRPARLLVATPPIIAADLAWVVGSIVTVMLGWYSGGGIAAVMVVAAMVETFAVMQWYALGRIRRDRRSSVR